MRAFKCAEATCSCQDDDRYQSSQPVGEYPQVPSMARAYGSLDEVATENRDLRAAREQLQRDNVALAAKLEDSRFELNAVTDLLKQSGHHVAALSDNLCSYQSERDELRDQLEELDDCRELQVRVQELEAELAKAQAARDTAKAQASVTR